MLMSEALDGEIEGMQKRNILKIVRPGSLPKQIMKLGKMSTINMCVLSCCDGHQFMDTTKHTFECSEVAKKEFGIDGLGEDCFHWKTENGGPFTLAVPDLMNRTYRGEIDHVDRNVLASIHEGISLKKLNVVLLIGHAICGKMKDKVDSLEQYAYFLAKAKTRIMAEMSLPKEQVITQLQCHRKNGERRTYHIDYSEAVSLRHAA